MFAEEASLLFTASSHLRFVGFDVGVFSAAFQKDNSFVAAALSKMSSAGLTDL